MERTSPAYLELAHSGELERRARAAVDSLARCLLCPRVCESDRLQGEEGICRVGMHARVASSFPHHGEESCLSGTRGSGTIFFAGCSLRCVFCQNWEISHDCQGEDVDPEGLARRMVELASLGCHNINWVTPTHVVPQLLAALDLAVKKGFRLPIVYNTGGYDSVETLRLLDGVVDIYLPDFKLWDEGAAQRFLKAADYPEVARAAIREMHRQVGDLVLDEDGLARRGLLVRHLVLPGGVAGTSDVTRWLAREISPSTVLHILGQYHPAGLVPPPGSRGLYTELCAAVAPAELHEAVLAAREAGLGLWGR
jgi:putative pyruvate formate lyase activating enzyme